MAEIVRPKVSPKGKSMTRSIVVGANRGIGLEITRKLVERGDEVIATSRKPSSELSEIDCKDVVIGVDVTSGKSLEALTRAAGAQAVEEIWLVAGIMLRNTLDDLDAKGMVDQFRVNAMGPLLTVSSLRRNLSRGTKIGILTSRMGSIADNDSGGAYGYRMSKSAVNAAGKSLALDLKDEGVAVALFHPGWVKTDMTGGTGHVTAAESAAGLIEQMAVLSMATSGSFVHANGEKLPW